jgi:hypothetical protein
MCLWDINAIHDHLQGLCARVLEILEQGQDHGTQEVEGPFAQLRQGKFFLRNGKVLPQLIDYGLKHLGPVQVTL